MNITEYIQDNLIMVALIGAVVVVALVAGISLFVVKRRRQAKMVADYFAAEEAKKQAEQKPVEPVKPAPKKTAKKVEEPVEEVVEEDAPVEEEKPAPKKTTRKTTKKVEEPVEEVVEEDAPVEEEKPAPKKTTKKPSKKQEVEETIAMVEEMDEIDAALQEDDAEEKHSRYAGKWVICRIITDDEEDEEMFFFELRASNGEKLLVSEEYTTYQGALKGIATHKANILKGNLKITLSKKGDYIFKLLSGKNMLLCMGENYPTKARCESAIESTMRFAETAIIDENVQDIVVQVPQETEEDVVVPADENNAGKWIIYTRQSDGEEEIFFFELFANNGEKLLSSEEYTSYIGAVNGIQTHKKNIESNNFRISLTKRGDYIYKLLNGNGQLLCLGEHYKSKRLCENAVDSVRRFAANSPVLAEEKE